jgi:hypothetical protein
MRVGCEPLMARIGRAEEVGWTYELLDDLIPGERLTQVDITTEAPRQPDTTHTGDTERVGL